MIEYFCVLMRGTGWLDIMGGHRLGYWGSIPGRQIFFSPARLSDRLWGPPVLLLNV